jgi:hypothetical protein
VSLDSLHVSIDHRVKPGGDEERGDEEKGDEGATGAAGR